MAAFLRKDLETFIASQIILMESYYVLSIRLLYYYLLESFLEIMIIVGNYKKIMIQSICLRKLKNRERKIILIEFPGHHRVQI
jgi:hypothetical protein